MLQQLSGSQPNSKHRVLGALSEQMLHSLFHRSASLIKITIKIEPSLFKDVSLPLKSLKITTHLDSSEAGVLVRVATRLADRYRNHS